MENNLQNIKAVIFDVDGTLSSQISWTALTKDLGASVEKHLEIFKEFKEQKTTYEVSKKKLLILWKETGNAKRQFLEQLFINWPLRKDAEEIISFLKNKEYLLCIITGSFDLYAQIIAKRLGIKYYFANTKLDWDSKGNLTDFHYFKDQASKKLEQFTEFCKMQNIKSENCVAVGDDENNIKLFKIMKGIAVKSIHSEPLEEIAWKTINNLLELKEILSR